MSTYRPTIRPAIFVALDAGAGSVRGGAGLVEGLGLQAEARDQEKDGGNPHGASGLRASNNRIREKGPLAEPLFMTALTI